jgi:hypothetical protein
MATQRFEEIDVERINVREPDGTLRATIASNARQPDPVLEGTPDDRTGSRGAGMLFFNDEGFECGGLVFGGKDGEASASLTFDRYGTDQIVQFAYGEREGMYEAGMVVMDRPATPITDLIEEQRRIKRLPQEEQTAAIERMSEGLAARIVIGRGPDGRAGVLLNDSKNRPRIRLEVDGNDEPRLQFLDADGNVTFSLPPGA